MKWLIAVCFTILIIVVPTQAQLVNGGFETGDLTGWTFFPPSGGDGGFAGAVTGHTDLTGPPWTSPPLVFPVSDPPGVTDWGPSSGSYFGLLKTNGPGSAAFLWQAFTVPAGATLRFDYFWDSQDYVEEPPCFDDAAAGTIVQGVGLGGAIETILFTESVYNDLAVHGSNYWGTAWTQVSHTFTVGGTYTLVLAIENVCDDDLDAHVGIDNVEIDEFTVSVDIKPGSCPNPLNVKSQGVLPVAILGTEALDVHDIAWAELACVEPLRIAYEDVATPFEDDLCDCHEAGPDGILDLVLHFDTQEIAEGLAFVGDEAVVELNLTGQTVDGLWIEGSDCIRVLKKGKVKD